VDKFNPFPQGAKANPFYTQGAATVDVVQEPANPLFGKTSTQAKEDELARREKELEKRLAALAQREQNLGRAGGEKTKNWPSFYPIVYHSIEDDIPVEKQKVVKLAFYSYLGLVLCLLVNWLCVSTALIASSKNTGDWLWASIYMITGIPGGWWLWYIRLYNACKGDRALTFFLFFCTYLVHCVFCLWAALAPEGILGTSDAFCGLFAVIDRFDDNTVVGFFYLVGFLFWVFEALLSMTVMSSAYKMFRGQGGGERLQEEAAGAAFRHGAQHGLRSAV